MAKLIQVNGDLEVKKADIIVKSRYKLKPLSLKFITTLIAGLKRGDDINEVYQFKVKDFQELTKLKRKDLYWAVKEALKELLEKPLYIPKGKDENDNSFLMLNWVASAEYKEGEGIIEFEISNKLRPYLLEAQKKFLKYRLENILSLRSSYSIRMYEILKDWLNTYSKYHKKTEKILKVDEIRQMLEIPRSYRYNDIKKRILEKAKTELIENTDVMFDYEEIKTGRKVTNIKFFVKENPKNIKPEEIITHKQNVKSMKDFVAFVRKQYNNTKRSFAMLNTKTKIYALYIRNNLIIGENKTYKKHLDFQADESKKIYYNWWQIARNCPQYYEIVKNGLDFKNIILNDKEFKERFNNLIVYLKKQGKIK